MGSRFRVWGTWFRVKGLGFRGGLVFKAHRWLYHSTIGSRVIKKKKVVRVQRSSLSSGTLFSFTLVTGPIRSLSLKRSDTRVYAPQSRARLRTTASVFRRPSGIQALPGPSNEGDPSN